MWNISNLDPNIFGSEYNWKSSNHPWNTFALSLTLHRQRRNLPYRRLVFTIQPFAFLPSVPLSLSFPRCCLFDFAIRVRYRNITCLSPIEHLHYVIGDGILTTSERCSLNRNTLSRQITIRYEGNVKASAFLRASFLYFSLSPLAWVIFLFSCHLPTLFFCCL